jgi:hypothetical protein
MTKKMISRILVTKKGDKISVTVGIPWSKTEPDLVWDRHLFKSLRHAQDEIDFDLRIGFKMHPDCDKRLLAKLKGAKA